MAFLSCQAVACSAPVSDTSCPTRLVIDPPLSARRRQAGWKSTVAASRAGLVVILYWLRHAAFAFWVIDWVYASSVVLPAH